MYEVVKRRLLDTKKRVVVWALIFYPISPSPATPCSAVHDSWPVKEPMGSAEWLATARLAGQSSFRSTISKYRLAARSNRSLGFGGFSKALISSAMASSLISIVSMHPHPRAPRGTASGLEYRASEIGRAQYPCASIRSHAVAPSPVRERVPLPPLALLAAVGCFLADHLSSSLPQCPAALHRRAPGPLLICSVASGCRRGPLD